MLTPQVFALVFMLLAGGCLVRLGQHWANSDVFFCGVGMLLGAPLQAILLASFLAALS